MDRKKNTDPSNFKKPDKPVDSVNYLSITEFIKKLNKKSEDEMHSLPSEAQWEYACRAGTTSDFNTGSSLNTRMANYNGNLLHIHSGSVNSLTHQQ